MTDVDPVEFVQILQYFAQSVFTRGRTFLMHGHVSFFIWGVWCTLLFTQDLFGKVYMCLILCCPLKTEVLYIHIWYGYLLPKGKIT